MRIRNTIIAGILVSFISLVEADSSYSYIEQHPLKIAVANNIEMSYREIGVRDNPKVLLIMGLGASHLVHGDNLVRGIEQAGYQVLIFDNRDTGGSTRFDDWGQPTIWWQLLKDKLGFRVDAPYALEDMTADAVGLLDAVGYEDAHVIGFSMGGMIAQIIAANHPKRIKSFTLIASTAATPSPFNSPTREVRNLILDRSITKDASYEDRYQRAVKLIKVIGMEGYKFDTPEFKQQAIENMKRSKDDTGFSRQLLAILASKNRFKKIQSIKIPTLIVHGKDDPLLKVKNAYKMHKLIPASELIIIEDMRHLIEQPILDQFKDRLIIHLNSNS